MTREEAVGKINAIKKYLTAGNPIWDVREIDEALNMAIKALEQEPVVRCKDCEYWTKQSASLHGIVRTEKGESHDERRID